MRTKAMTATLSVLALGMTAACGGGGGGGEAAPGAEERGPIKVWLSNNPEEIAWGKAMVEEWNADNPDQKVTAQEIPAGKTSEEVIGAAITAGNAPCLVFNTSPAAVPQFQKQGGLVPLDSFEGATDYIEERSGDVAEQYKSPDGSYYQIPWKSNPVMIFYNKDIMEKAGFDPENLLVVRVTIPTAEVGSTVFCFVAREGLVRSVTPNAREVLGDACDRAPELGLTLCDLLQPESRARLDDWVARAWLPEPPPPLTLPTRGPTSGRRWLELATPGQVTLGNGRSLLSEVREVTDRSEREQHARLLARALDVGADPAFISAVVRTSTKRWVSALCSASNMGGTRNVARSKVARRNWRTRRFPWFRKPRRSKPKPGRQQERRLARVQAGVEALNLWLDDLIRNGFVSSPDVR